MNKKCLCLTGLMVFLLISFIDCEAEELHMLNAPRQTEPAQKQDLQNKTVSPTVDPKETTKRLLPKKRGDLLHIAFEKGYIGKGVTLEPVVLQDAYTIEVILKPSGKQVAYAGIVGNHTPDGGLEGFVVQQVALEQNVYTMCVSDGSKGACSSKFTLKEGTWHYLAVVCNDMNTLQIYIDGSLVGKFTPLKKIKNSSLPLLIGNWENGNRPFSGNIAEVRIANSPLDKKDIEMRWNKIKLQLPNM